jgi:methylenetetrahydrofolate reductase (NADPH)
MPFFADKSGLPTLSFEFFPPKEASGLEHVKSQIKELAQTNPDLVTITYGAAGGTRNLSKDLVRFVAKETNLEICPHLTCAGHSKAELEKIVSDYEEMGIDRILALRGDPPKGETKFTAREDGYSSARDFVRHLSNTTQMHIAVAGYPEIHKEAKSKDADLMYLKEKVDAGAQVVITQLFFDEDVYFQFVDDARKLGINVPILPGILPISNIVQLRRFTEMCGATIPQRIQTKLEDYVDDQKSTIEFGIEEASRLCSALLKGGAPGIHLYTLNKTVQILPIVKSLSGFYSATT